VLEVSQGQSTSRTARGGLLCAGVKQTSDGPGLRQGTEVCQTFPRSPMQRKT